MKQHDDAQVVLIALRVENDMQLTCLLRTGNRNRHILSQVDTDTCYSNKA